MIGEAIRADVEAVTNISLAAFVASEVVMPISVPAATPQRTKKVPRITKSLLATKAAA